MFNSSVTIWTSKSSFTDAVVCKLNAMCARIYSISYYKGLAVGRKNDASSGSDRLQCYRPRQNKRSAVLQAYVCVQE